MVWLVLMAATLAGCAAGGPAPGGPGLQQHEFTRIVMGVQTRLVFFAPDREAALHAAEAAYAELARLDQVMSDYRPDSELSRLSDTAGSTARTALSPDLFEILRTGQEIAVRTGGAFDVTVGAASKLWRAMRDRRAMAGSEELAAARATVDYRRLELDPATRSARLLSRGTRLDLGAIAKGYAAEKALGVLTRLGCGRGLVALAGDIAVGAPPPGARGWRIDLDAGQGGAVRTLLVANASVSTSGDTAQFLTIDGRRFAHIIDPRTGLGTPGGISVSVVAPRGDWADALATAACVLGPTRAGELLRSVPGAAGVITWHEGGGVKEDTVDSRGVLRWAPPAGPTGRLSGGASGGRDRAGEPAKD